MFNVSNAYKIAAMEPAQEHRLTGTIGSVSFDEENIVAGSFNIQKQSTDSNSMVLGSCYIGQLTATFTGINLARGAWLNKTIAPSFALKLANNSWETIPMGIYKIKEAVHTAEGVQVTAYDNMIKFDKKIKNKKTTLGFVTDSMWTFIDLCCRKCNVTLGMTKAQIDALPNGYRQQSDIEIFGDAGDDDFANDIETYRDLLYWCAQTVGCFATIDRAGQLIFRQYTQNIDEAISDTVRLSGANFEDYVTHFTGILVTDMDTNDDTYYGYDADELLVQLNETSEDLTEANDDLTDNLAAQAELDQQYAQHEITEQEYIAQKAVLTAEEKDIRQLIKKLNKRLGWLEAELHDAQNDEEGAIMNLGANPFVQYFNLTKRDNTRKRILGAMSNISYTPFTASMVCGAHYDLGDIIQFTGGHSDNDICCVMSWSYTHNMGTELEGFGTDSAQQQVRVRNKAEKQADRANSTASNTGHTYVTEADPDTETGAPRSSKQGDIWVDINQDPPTPEPGDPGMTLIQVASTDVTDDWSASYSVNNDGTYNLVFTGNNTEYYTGKNLAAVFEITNAPADVDIDYTVSGDFTYTGTFASDENIRGLGLAFNNRKSDFRWNDYDPGFHDDSNGKAHLQVAANSGTIHYTGTFDSTGDSSNKLYMMVGINGTRVIQQGVEGYGGGTLTIENFSITRPGVVPQPGPIIPGERTAGKMYANDNGEWREVKRITDISQSEAAGGPVWNGLEKDDDSEVISLKKNVVRAWYKADPPQTTRNFSQLCVRYTGEPDKFIDIEPYADHTFEDKEVKSDDENAFYIKCGGVGGSGSYCAYKLTGLVAGARYYFNFAYNFSNNAEFGDDTTKGLGLVFNTTGTISTDDWSGDEDTFDETTKYYSMKRSTTKHYADFSFTATATTMYMCVVTADETGGQDITLILNEFVIADSERKFIRNIYLYDYEKNVWLKYRPFGSITGGSDDGGGSVVRIIPVLSQGTKIADYTIDGEPGALYAPEYTLPIASANTLGGIKVGQNLTIDPATGVLDATGGGDLDAVELTYAQYQALSPEQKADPNTIYFITDYPASVGAMNDLTDVDITTPTEGQILTYDATDDEWKNTDVDDVTPTVTEASARANLASGDSLKTIIGKIKKFFSDLKAVAFSGSYNDLSDTPTIPTVNNGTLTIKRNNTSVGTFTANQSTASNINIECATPSDIEGSKTASGSVVTVNDAAPIYAEQVDVAIVATQTGSGTPSPSNVRPIQGYDIVSVDRCGKNIWGGTAMLDEFYSKVPSATKTDNTVSFTGANVGGKIFAKLPYKANTAYTFILVASLSVSNINSNLRIYYTDGTSVLWRNSDSSVNTKKTIVVVTDASKTVDYVMGENQAGTLTVYFNESGVFEGNIATSAFEPYNGQTVSLQLGNKNLLPMTVEGIKELNNTLTWNGNSATRNGITYTIFTNKDRCVAYIDANGTANAESTLTLGTCPSDGKPYKLNGSTGGSNNTYSVRVGGYGGSGDGDFSFTPTSANNVYIQVISGQTISHKKFYPMIRDANVSDPTFSPYNPTLGGMVYGGQLTLNDDGSAVFVGDKAEVDLGSLTWTYNSGMFYSITGLPAKQYNAIETQNIISSIYPAYTWVDFQSITYGMAFQNASNTLRIKDTRYTDATIFTAAMVGQQLVYELATPFTIHLSAEQLKLLQGTNNVWSNAGDVTLKYQPDNVIAEPKADVQRLRDDVDDRLVGNACKNLVFRTITGASINSSGSVISNSQIDLQVARVEQGVTYTATENRTPANNFTAGFFTDIPIVGSVTYNGGRYSTASPTFIAPITGYVAFWTNTGYLTPQLERGSSPTAYEEYYPSNRELVEQIVEYVPYSTGGTIIAHGAWADSYSNTEIAIRPKVNTKGTVGSSDYKFSRGYFVELSVGSAQSDTAPSGGNRSRGYIYLHNTSSDYSVYLSAPTATASRSITFPDAAGTVSVSGSSSIKTKKNVTDMTDAEAEKLLSLRPVNYDYKNEENGTDCYGLIAEEVQSAGIEYPVFTMHDDDLDEDVPALDYAKFVPYLIKMVQKQQKQIDAMQKQIDELMEIKK